MTYATLQNLTDRYGEQMLVGLTDRAEMATGNVDTDVVDRALADADAVIDSYIKSRYKLPLETTPPVITNIAEQLAIYKLHRHSPDDKIKDEHNDAKKALTDIAKGIAILDVAGVEPSGSSSAGVITTDKLPEMTHDNMKQVL